MTASQLVGSVPVDVRLDPTPPSLPRCQLPPAGRLSSPGQSCATPCPVGATVSVAVGFLSQGLAVLMGVRDERTIGLLGAPQHGIVTHSQLLAAGFTRHEIQYLLDRGRLEPVHRGVYRTAGSPRTWDQLMLAGAIYASGQASHRSCAHLWGVDLAGTPPIELVVTASRAPRKPGLIVHRSVDLPPGIRRRGIPTTGPLRMLAELGAVVDAEQVGVAVDSLLSRRIVTIDGIEHFRRQMGGRGRNGVGVLGEVLASRPLGRAAPDSMLEPVMAQVCRTHGLEMPAYQVWVEVNGVWRRLDFAYAAEMIDIEVDGYGTHGAIYDTWVDDSVRDNELTALGWEVLRFPREVVQHKQAYVARIIRTVLADRRRLRRVA